MNIVLIQYLAHELQFNPIFGPKLGEDQKKGLHLNLVRFFGCGPKTKVFASGGFRGGMHPPPPT